MRFLAILYLSTLLSAPAREWRDSIRDVYINGKLDRAAQTLTTTTTPRLFAVVCGDEVMIFDQEANAVSRASKADFTFAADRTSATTNANLTGQRAGVMVRANDVTSLGTLDGKTILVSAHQSKAGPMTKEDLWQTMPVWQSIAESYEPDAAIIERLNSIDQPTHLEIVLATWCGDSRHHVPRLVKAIERAANPNVTFELTGLGPEFESPMELVQGRNITNVPTVIVKRGANEIGRYVETPAAKTIEEDICDIADGAQKPHPSRHERGKLLTRGTYQLRDARRREQGVEVFEIYERSGGGNVVHSMIRKRDGTSIETWASIDSEKKPRFVEITHRGATTTRTRFNRTGETWSAQARGANGGIVTQVVASPAALVTPATITYTWARDAARAYVIPENGVGAVRETKFRIDTNDVPKFVRLEDGSSRRLVNQAAVK